MPDNIEPETILSFTWTHFATEGKMDNMIETLNELDADQVCLSIIEPSVDALLPETDILIDRLSRVRDVIAILNKKDHDITAHLIVPGILSSITFEKDAIEKLNALYGMALQTKATVIWCDDATFSQSPHQPSIDWSGKASMHNFSQSYGHKVSTVQINAILAKDTAIIQLTKKEMQTKIAWHAYLKDCLTNHAKTIHTACFSKGSKKRITVGLIGATPKDYMFAITSHALSNIIAKSKNAGLLATSQLFTNDTNRCAILDAAEAIALSAAVATEDANTAGTLCGYMTITPVGPFHKSSESLQMAININHFYCIADTLLHAFDETGSAVEKNDPYINALNNRTRFVKKLETLLGDSPQPIGIRVIIDPTLSGQHNSFLKLLWRLGFTATVETPETLNASLKQYKTVTVLTGNTPLVLSVKQLNAIFDNGVLLDATSALHMQNMGLGEMLGTKIGGPIKDVRFEIFSDQTLAAPYYGYRTVCPPFINKHDFKSLTPFTDGVHVISTLEQAGSIPNTTGMITYDNDDKQQRVAILPYTLSEQAKDRWLTPQRKRHLHDLFWWLQQSQLTCHVEATPDLVPFYIPINDGKRIVLALMNISFDWALEARVRFGNLPQKIKRVRELNEQGKYENDDDLTIARDGLYSYLDITNDTAIAPMQMGIFILD